LARRGIPAARVETAACDGFSDWDRARSLGAWLAEHPEANLIALSSRFTSRRWRLLLEKALSIEETERVHVRGVRHAWYDEANWWQQKDGVIDVFDAYLKYGYVRFAGEDARDWQEWDPNQYRLETR
jgi:hypothetical protein